MQKTRKVHLTGNTDIAVLDDGSATEAQAQPLVPAISLPEEQGLDLAETGRVRPNTLDTVETTRLAELSGRGVEVPGDRGAADIDGVLGLGKVSKNITANGDRNEMTDPE